MRSATQIGKRILLIESDSVILDLIQDLFLVDRIFFLIIFLGLFQGELDPLEGMILLDDFGHAILDLLYIFV